MSSKGGSTSSTSGGWNDETTSTQIPDWVSSASQSALSQAQAINATPYESLYSAAGGNLVAAQSPYTTQGYNAIENLQGMTTPGYTAAENVYSSLLGQAAPITANQLTGLTNQLYSNYNQGVTDPAQGYFNSALQGSANALNSAQGYSQGQFGNALNYSQNQLGNAMNQSTGLFGTALGGAAGELSGFTPYAAPATAGQVVSNVNQLMNPYEGLVVSPTETLMQQQLAQNLQSNAASAANVGAYGGSRMGVQNAVAQAQEPVLAGQYLGNLLYQGYNANLPVASNLATTASQQGYNAASQLAGYGMTAAEQLANQGYQSAADLASQEYGSAGQLATQGYNSAALQASQQYNAANALASLLQSGYSSAGTTAYNTANLNQQLGLTAASQLPQEYQAQANEAATEAGLLESAGTSQQNYQQSLINAALSNYMWQNYYPQQQLNTYLSALSSVPYDTTSTSYGFGSSNTNTTTNPSWGSMAGSVGLLAAAALL